MKKILITANTFWNIHNFRIGLLNYLVKKKYEIIIVAPTDKSLNNEYKKKFKFIDIKIDRKGTNIFKDFIVLVKYLIIFYKERPEFVLSYTIKPNIYASIASHLLNIKVINNISGLGSSFIKDNYMTKIVIFLYKIAFSKSKYIFFENKNDLDFFIFKKIISSQKGLLIPGCGIDVKFFQNFKPNNIIYKSNKNFNFLIIARLIKDKGIFEYINAAKIISKKNINIEFRILGFEDKNNPSHIDKNVFTNLIKNSNINYLGETDDVRPYIYYSNCVVLPSYREGTPKSLLEAMAMAKPIIATNVSGCIEVLDDNINGLLCNVKDSKDLADKMLRMINLQNSDRLSMGNSGLNKVINEFDQKIINNLYIKIINEY